MVQLTVKFTLACAIHMCVVQFYLSDLSELACHTRVILLMRVKYYMQVRLCVLQVSKNLHVKSDMFHGNKTWQVQCYSTLLYCMVVLVY